MKRVLISATLAYIFLFSGCNSNNDQTKKQIDSLSLKSDKFSTDANTIITDKDSATTTIIGEKGSKLYINGDYYGEFDDSGKMVVKLTLKHDGSTIFRAKSISKDGDSKTVEIQVIKSTKSSKLGEIETKGIASALTVSQNGTMFVAENGSGVEIISIGFNDKISSDLLSTIDGFDAKNVILSDDEARLYVEDKSGKYHVIDISDISNPVEVDVIDEFKKSSSVTNSNNTKRYRVSPCGLIGESVTKSDNKRDFLLKDKDIKDVVLVDNDTKLLVAHGEDGLELFDLKDEKNPTLISTKPLGGDTSGLSLIKKDGILFVANGEKGVAIFNLDILLDEMSR